MQDVIKHRYPGNNIVTHAGSRYHEQGPDEIHPPQRDIAQVEGTKRKKAVMK